MKKSYLLILLGLVLLAFLFSRSRDVADPSEDAGRYGTLPGAYDLKEFGEGESHTFSYFVHIPFPPRKALAFYDRSLKRKGWRSDPAWKGMGEQGKWTSWSAQSAATSTGFVCVHQLHKGWIHQDGRRFLILTLNYYDQLEGAACEPTPKAPEMLVTLQEMPRR
jgi:hypothetical protein